WERARPSLSTHATLRDKSWRAARHLPRLAEVSRCPVPLRTSRTDLDFADRLVADAAGVVGQFLLVLGTAVLHLHVAMDVRLAAKGVAAHASGDNHPAGARARRNHARTQLAAEHQQEPMSGTPEVAQAREIGTDRRQCLRLRPSPRTPGSGSLTAVSPV